MVENDVSFLNEDGPLVKKRRAESSRKDRNRISEFSSEDENLVRDFIGTCFTVIVFKILMELRDRYDLIGL
jgi:hypothetical protein